MKRFEYKWAIREYPDINLDAAKLHKAWLNDIGQQGWELVDVYAANSAMRMIFKREIT